MSDLDEQMELNEDHVCTVAAGVLREMSPDNAPSVEELRLNFRVGLDSGTLFEFDLETPMAEGEGAGGYLDEFTITIIINLVSAVLFEILRHGIRAVRNSERWKSFKQRLLNSGGRAKPLIEDKIEEIREAVLDLPPYKDSEEEKLS